MVYLLGLFKLIHVIFILNDLYTFKIRKYLFYLLNTVVNKKTIKFLKS